MKLLDLKDGPKASTYVSESRARRLVIPFMVPAERAARRNAALLLLFVAFFDYCCCCYYCCCYYYYFLHYVWIVMTSTLLCDGAAPWSF